MAGLNSLISDTTSSTTTLPSWYDTAQQNIVNQATAGAAQVPQLQNTVAGGAIQNLSGAQNPFFQAQGQLSQIGTGAANPWITDASGNVTPNTSTALGGLFAAQQKQLEQTLPTTIAPAQAGAIGSGNFGSLRGLTAVDTAKANALADLQSKQMQAALQSQQTGVNAAQALGNVGAQGTSTMTTLGQAQQAAPLTAVSDLAQILGAVRAPATVTQSAQLSPLSQLGSLGSAVTGGVSGLNSLVGSLFPAQGVNAKTGALIPATLGSVFGKSLQSLLGLGGTGTGGSSGLTDSQIQSIISGGGANTLSGSDLTNMVSSGTITQSQADQIMAANQANQDANAAMSGDTSAGENPAGA